MDGCCLARYRSQIAVCGWGRFFLREMAFHAIQLGSRRARLRPGSISDLPLIF
jgi:hypothetical protein